MKTANGHMLILLLCFVQKFVVYILYFQRSRNGVIAKSLLNIYTFKWKNHFCEMKGDVGMSVHEKEREQEDA